MLYKYLHSNNNNNNIINDNYVEDFHQIRITPMRVTLIPSTDYNQTKGKH